MKACIIIPCYNHSGSVAAVARAARAVCPVIVVDDGSTDKMPELPDCTVLRLEPNTGKGAALRAGLQRAAELGYTHGITMDADGQHFAEDLPKFLAALEEQPGALVVGIRNLAEAGAPRHRQRSNAVSSFWFRVETGVALRDTQCGFRGYPLELAQRVKTKSGRYAFELEFMVRAAWIGAPIVAVPVKCIYEPRHMLQSHFRPVVDLARITGMNFGLVLQSWLVPRTLREAWSVGTTFTTKKTLHELFSENAHEPVRLASAVGVGLFCGIAPIWGFQIITAIAVSHWLNLNKAIAVVSSHISLPPLVPLIWFAGLEVGHRLLQGVWLPIALSDMTWHGARQYGPQYVGESILGSFVLAAAVAVSGFLVAWTVARLWRPR